MGTRKPTLSQILHSDKDKDRYKTSFCCVNKNHHLYFLQKMSLLKTPILNTILSFLKTYSENPLTESC